MMCHIIMISCFNSIQCAAPTDVPTLAWGMYNPVMQIQRDYFLYSLSTCAAPPLEFNSIA